MNLEASLKDDPVVREEVFAHIKDTFGIHIHSYIPNLFGLYNMKWIVKTSSNNLFIKCYHPKRYRLSEPHRRSKIERSLFFQQMLHNESDICPGIWCKDGEFVLESQSGHFYVIMECFNGSSPHADLVNVDMMYGDLQRK
jgi:homoserine kinase type II